MRAWQRVYVWRERETDWSSQQEVTSAFDHFDSGIIKYDSCLQKQHAAVLWGKNCRHALACEGGYRRVGEVSRPAYVWYPLVIDSSTG